MATANDRAILNSIINPLQPTEEFTDDFCTEVDEASVTITCELEGEQDRETKELEKQGVTLAESGKLTDALDVFNKAVIVSPLLPSVYNNRAQTYRLLNRNEDALDDLNKAIEYSQGKGKAAAQAFCQRAMLHHIAGNTVECDKDWQSAAALGSQFAKRQLAQKNPYAALCNKMLLEVFTSLKTGNIVNNSNCS